jgi:G3E family GTPase
LLWEKDDAKESYDVLRLKGMLTFAGKKRRFALQGVRETWQLEKTQVPNNGEPSLLVFIGRNLRIQEWKERLLQCCK